MTARVRASSSFRRRVFERLVEAVRKREKERVKSRESERVRERERPSLLSFKALFFFAFFFRFFFFRFSKVCEIGRLDMIPQTYR